MIMKSRNSVAVEVSRERIAKEEGLDRPLFTKTTLGLTLIARAETMSWYVRCVMGIYECCAEEVSLLSGKVHSTTVIISAISKH